MSITSFGGVDSGDSSMVLGGIRLNAGFDGVIKSVKLGSEVEQLVLFSHNVWRGSEWTVGADTAHLELGGLHSIGSFEMIPRVPRGCVKLFFDSHYRGRGRTVCHHEVFVGWIWNDEVTSMVVAPAVTVRVFKYYAYSGESVLIDTNTPNLGVYGMNDEISSICILTRS